MALSNDLISQFVKMTNDSTKKNEIATTYGTVVAYDGGMYVKLDGSDLLTPVDTTTELRDNDRVLVNIGGHNATVSGNMTNPAVCMATAGELHSEIVQTAESIRLEVRDTERQLNSKIEQTAESIRLEVSNVASGLNSKIEQTANSLTATITDTKNNLESQISQTSTTISTRITNVESNLNSKITQTATDLTIMFDNGYSKGITTVNKDGIKVQHSGYGGYTHMAPSGFYLNNGSSDVLKCTSSGLVYTGTITASSIQSTDGTFAIDKNGNIAGATLTTSKGTNFSIDEHGNLIANGLAVEDNISTGTIACTEILNKAYPKTLTSSITLWVNSSTGSNDSKCVNNAVFQTLQGALDALPKFLNGKVVNIYLQTANVGNVNFTYFSSGRIFLYLQRNTVYGGLNFYHTSAAIFVYGGSSTSDTDCWAQIHPSKGISVSGRTSAIYMNVSRYVGLYWLDVWASDNYWDGDSGDKLGIASQGGGFTYCSNIWITNCNIGYRCFSGAHIHMNSSGGVASIYGFQALTGGRISFANNAQSGGVTAATNTNTGGQILKNSCTFASGGASSGGGSASTTTQTVTKTFTASSAQALQYAGTSSAFWRTDSRPKVGNWGYGAHTGWWFFGDDFEAIANKNVSKIEISFYREKAGYYAATTHYLYAHSYETQPGTTSPSYNTSRVASLSVAAQTTGSVTITDSAAISRIKASKGICSVPPSQNSTYYSVMGASMKVKFTYTE